MGQEHRTIPYLECMQYYVGNATAAPSPSTILSVEPMTKVSPVRVLPNAPSTTNLRCLGDYEVLRVLC